MVFEMRDLLCFGHKLPDIFKHKLQIVVREVSAALPDLDVCAAAVVERQIEVVLVVDARGQHRRFVRIAVIVPPEGHGRLLDIL